MSDKPLLCANAAFLLPNHHFRLTMLRSQIFPTYTKQVRDDALFHYTTGAGLLGILKSNELWSTAYHCANDESELSAGRDVLTPIFREKAHEMIMARDARVQTFAGRGVDVHYYADRFEETIVSAALHAFSVYITCFCKPNTEEDFIHGLLSQWRGYGDDGGYAIQFSRERLEEELKRVSSDEQASYRLKDVYYTNDNSMKNSLVGNAPEFEKAFENHLDSLIKLDLNPMSLQNVAGDLPTYLFIELLDYLIHTKSIHFREENECRLSALDATTKDAARLQIDYLNRSGLLVPYARTPSSAKIVECIDWIVVGPAPRIDSRYNSIIQMVRSMGFKIKVRASRIPFSRL